MTVVALIIPFGEPGRRRCVIGRGVSLALQTLPLYDAGVSLRANLVLQRAHSISEPDSWKITPGPWEITFACNHRVDDIESLCYWSSQLQIPAEQGVDFSAAAAYEIIFRCIHVILGESRSFLENIPGAILGIPLLPNALSVDSPPPLPSHHHHYVTNQIHLL